MIPRGMAIHKRKKIVAGNDIKATTIIRNSVSFKKRFTFAVYQERGLVLGVLGEVIDLVDDVQ